MSMFDKLGSSGNPIVLGTYESEDLKEILKKGEIEYSYADPEDKGVVRATYREVILKRWPQLYDYAHVRIVWNDDDYWRKATEDWIKRVCRSKEG